MIWFAVGALAAARFKLLTVQRFAFIAPASMLTWYAASGSTISALAAWVSAVFVLGLLWREQRG